MDYTLSGLMETIKLLLEFYEGSVPFLSELAGIEGVNESKSIIENIWGVLGDYEAHIEKVIQGRRTPPT